MTSPIGKSPKQAGFTLIELIIVIVILGILAVTAAPRFIDIQTDARKEVLQGVKAAVQSSAKLIYAKAVIAGAVNAENDTVTVGTDTVNIRYGYPDARDVDALSNELSALEIKKFIDIDLGPVTGETFELEYNPSFDADGFQIKFTNSVNGLSANNVTTGCFVEYYNAENAGDVPTITVVDNAC